MNLHIEINNENGQFENRLEKVKTIAQNGINYNLFWGLMSNLRNGPTDPTYYNELNLEDWQDLYENCGIAISQEQIELVFEYVSEYYSQILRKSADSEYRQLLRNNLTNDDNPFGFEMIVLKTVS